MQKLEIIIPADSRYRSCLLFMHKLGIFGKITSMEVRNYVQMEKCEPLHEARFIEMFREG